MPGEIEVPSRWPLYSPLGNRNANVPPLQDARLINGYVEYDPASKDYWIYKRLGLGPNTILSGFSYTLGLGQGMYQSPSLAQAFQLFAVISNNLYVGPQFIQSLIGGSAPSSTIKYSFETVNSNPLTIFISSPYDQWLYNTATQNMTYLNNIITPGLGQPNLVPGVVYLDQTLYVMDQLGNIHGSNLNDATIWNPLNVVAANSNSDLPMALAKQLNYIIALKQNSTQVFFDNSNPAPGSPLSPVNDSQIPLGCFAPYSVQSIDNVLLWMSSNESISPQVVQLNNLEPTIVSTPQVERLLQNATASAINFGGGGILSWTLKIAGHRFYGLVLLNQNLTLVYDLDQKAWYIWTDSKGNFWPIIATCYQGGFNTNQTSGPLLAMTNLGAILNVDAADVYPNDNGVLVPVDIYTPNFDAGVDRIKQLNMMRFNADRGNTAAIKIRYNDWDYDTRKWSNFRTVSLTKKRPILPNCGSFYRRALHIRHFANTALRIKSVDLQMDIGVL